MRIPLFQSAQAGEGEEVIDDGLLLWAGEVAETEGDIFLHAQMWKQCVFLKDHADVPLFSRHHYVAR